MRPSLSTVTIGAALLAAACATTLEEPPPPPVMQVAGTYDGAFDVEGEALPGTLELTQDGTRLNGTFTSPAAGLTAEGTGVIDGDQVRMEFNYTMDCPGVARMTGTVREEGRRLTGTFQADDCTGGAAGTFSFRR